ncbi:tetratricopeptide repeat protein [Schwartzia succinivorans]|jgi:tetratricopeptide (TPR) repeat protein|uniref:Tetratricopeptide repeat-containing protein n=1 Tax=Schwartzia succinivorans DSM 10502 TaxID=1123243 RepID=A0A1M5B1P4_9FIRM|nr:tetratricopeptide repeat protein [Schwartzia succinivorans]SHF36350.1 Tetratricopeptide repeat-containing protein [Schwartzia succinivorans DSM 10502]
MIFQGKKFILAVFAMLMVFLSSATAFAAEPVTSVGYAKRAMEYYNNKQYDLAIEDYKKAIEMDDKNASLHMDLGALYAEKKDWEKARKHFTAAIELEHKAEAYVWRAITYLNQRRWPETVRNCKWALERDPMCADAHYVWGEYCITAGRLDRRYEGDCVADAIKHYSYAIRLNPNYIPAYKRRAEEYMTKGYYDRALADCQKVMELDPDNQQVQALMSKIQEKTAPPVEEKAPISLENGAGYPSAAGGTGSGRIEFVPRWHGPDYHGGVAIWRNRPSKELHREYVAAQFLYFEHDGRTTSKYHEGVLRGCWASTVQFDIIGYDDEGKPNTFLLYDGSGHGFYRYLCRLTVLDHDNVKIEWLNPCHDEWLRKENNPSSPEPAPVVREPSRECPYPVEIYTYRKGSESELKKIWDNTFWLKGAESFFMSEYGLYQVYDGHYQEFFLSGSLAISDDSIYESAVEALIVFWENGGGEVELYPEDAGDIVTG